MPTRPPLPHPHSPSGQTQTDSVPAFGDPLWGEMVAGAYPKDSDELREELQFLLADLKLTRKDLVSSERALNDPPTPFSPDKIRIACQELRGILQFLDKTEEQHSEIWAPYGVQPSYLVGSFFNPAIIDQITLLEDEKEILIVRMREMETEYHRLATSNRLLLDECLRLLDDSSSGPSHP